MQNKKERPKVREIVGANLAALIAELDKGNVEKACKRTGMGTTQVRRVMNAKHAVTMTTVERIAEAYELHAYQLLIPNLNPKNPQVLKEPTPTETKLYKVLETAMDEIKQVSTEN